MICRRGGFLSSRSFSRESFCTPRLTLASLPRSSSTRSQCSLLCPFSFWVLRCCFLSTARLSLRLSCTGKERYNPWLRATQRPSVFALIGIGDYIARSHIGALRAPEPCLLCRFPMPELLDLLNIGRCPHCRIDNPSLDAKGHHGTKDIAGQNSRWWIVYACVRCGGMVLAGSPMQRGPVTEIYPSANMVDEDIPHRAKEYLKQATESLHASAGAVMLAASSVDAMLKHQGYTEGSLYSRINKAKEDGLITEGMSDWAHEVRLDANDQRHADENADLPSVQDAQHCVDFATALGQFLFVLPARIARGRAAAQSEAA